MAKRGLSLGALGFVLGAIVGLSLVFLRQLIASQLTSLLSEEVAASCPCEFLVGEVDVSLLELKVTARNARIRSEGKDRLAFKKIEMWMDLSELRSRRVLISELRLIDGSSDGFLPGTPTFEFIDHLAAPIPPERDRPDRWKLKLQRLVLLPSFFIDTVGTISLQSSGATLVLDRTLSDDFTLDAVLGSLRVTGLAANPIDFEEVQGSLYLEDDFVEFRNIGLQSPAISASFDGFTQLKLGDLFDGRIRSSVDLGVLIPSVFSEGTLQSEAWLGGTLSRPRVWTKIALAADSTLALKSDGSPLTVLDTLISRGTILTDPSVALSCHELHGAGPYGSLRLESPLTLRDDTLAGSFSFQSSRIALGQAVLEDVAATVSLGGSLNTPAIAVKGYAEQLAFGDAGLGALELALSTDSRSVNGTALLTSPAGGVLSSQLEIDLSNPKQPSITQARLTAAGYHPGSAPIAISGDVMLRDGSSLDSISGEGSLTLVPTSLPSAHELTLDFHMASGALRLSGKDRAGTISVDAQTLFGGTPQLRLAVDSPGMDLAKLIGSEGCSNLQLELRYQAPLADPLGGSGTLKVPEFGLGCEMKALTLGKPFVGRIEEGVLQLAGLELTGAGAIVRVQGALDLEDGFDASAQGELNLGSLITLTPQFDELRGVLSMDLRARGALAEPALFGTLDLRDGELTIAAADISLTEARGHFLLEGGAVSVQPFSARLNGGNLDVRGLISPLSSSLLNLDAQLSGILLEPMTDGYVLTSGRLSLTTSNDNRVLLQGEVTVDSAEIAQQLNLGNVLADMTRRFLRGGRELKPGSQEPDIPLHLGIHISAANNIFLSTNFLSGEFGGDVTVSGTPAHPILQGQVEMLSGWIKIKDSYFDISSGTIHFSPGSPEPSLQLLAESYVATPTGDALLVFLEVTGNLSQPQLSFSSDRGLTQQQLLTLITESSSSFPQVFSGARGGLGASDISIFGKEGEDDLVNVLRRLTRIDAVTIEPGFSDQPGLAGPRVVAEKVLTENVSLVGESSLTSTEQESRFRLNYDLTSQLKMSGYVESSSSGEQSLLGLDFIFEALSRNIQVVSISVQGASTFSDKRILTELRISPRSRIRLSDLDRLGTRLQEFYAAQGFFDAQAVVECPTHRRNICRELTIQVTEGKRSQLVAAEISGAGQDLDFVRSELSKVSLNRTASERVRARTELAILRKLRSEGYIGARVQALYLPADNGVDRVLRVDAAPGTPVTFIFSGNKSFSAEELLATINLFTRRVPFGSNTPTILIRSIERLYRQTGRLYVAINHRKEHLKSEDRLVHYIEIDEGPVVPVVGVATTGALPESDEEFREHYASRFPDAVADTFSPKFAVEEELNAQARRMRVLLAEHGYPDASVDVFIKPTDDQQAVTIEYAVSLGSETRATTFSVSGLPAEIIAPVDPAQPYSVPKLNRYIEELKQTLFDGGYRNAAIDSVFDAESGLLTVNVIPGEVTRVLNISIEGAATADIEQVVRETMRIQSGQAWNVKVLQSDRERLLRLGLFSRVETEPQDGALDSPQEDLVVYLESRNLQSLRFGGGAKSEFGLHIFAEASDREIFLDGRSLSLRADLFLDPTNSDISEGTAGIQYSNPSLLGSEYVHTEDLRFQKLDLPAYEYDLDRISLTSYLFRAFEQFTTISFGHTLSFDHLTDVSPGAILSDLDTGDVRLSYIAASIRFDKRDNALNPDRGYIVALDSDFASEYLGSDADYVRIQPRAAWLRPFRFADQHFTFAALSHLGWGWALGDSEELPITERFLSGGRTSVRGFRENSLGPRGEDGAVIGGDILVANSLELRYRAVETLSLHTFFDFGTVFLRDLGTSWGDIRQSTGIGFRYLSPIGPLGFDIGHPLDERSGEPSLRAHFSIGSTF
ncbi:MAG: translocation/assembly module TamB domain-containing protein [Bdellovibrionota bacterium]|nr:MAG: translocation/assembly module TamB domain-containing protein [Bdellovibrionota bacterium]